MAGPHTLSLALGYLRGAVDAPGTLDPVARTVDLVWTTGARVRRYDFWTGTEWIEELAVTPEAVDLGRLRAGAPLLAAHQSYTLDGILGVVESATVADGEGRARVRFSEKAAADEIFRDVKAGIIRNVSVGYVTHEAEEVERTKGAPPVIRATRWEPLELSLVPVGADAGAGVRAADRGTAQFPCLVRRSGPMNDDPRARAAGGDPDEYEDKHTPAPAPAPKDPPADDPPPRPDPERAAAGRSSADELAGRRAERERIQGIRIAVKAARLEESLADTWIDQGVDADTARARVIDELAKRTPPIGGTVSVGDLGAARFRRGLENTILHRLRPDKWPLDEDGRGLVGRKFYELARMALEVSGQRTDGVGQLQLAGMALGLTKPERVRGDGFLTVSDFPAAMLNIARATLTDGYIGAPRTFPPWTRRTTLPDFRPMYRIALGTGPKLLKVPEHAEFQHGKYDLHAEQNQLQTWGRIIALTRQAIVNDDLSAFSRIPQQFGYAAAQMEGDAVYGILTSNPVMSDGNALFSVAHKNLAPAAFISLASMTVARQMMQVQASTEGGFLGLTPMYLICGPSLETEAYQFTSSMVVPTVPSGVIPQYFKTLNVVVDPRITDNAWFLAASPMQVDTIEYAYLEGAPEGGPVLESKEGWDIDGVEYKAREDFGAAAIEWRGLVMTASLAGQPTSEITKAQHDTQVRAEREAAEANDPHNKRK
jgi:hypothetical protein